MEEETVTKVEEEEGMVTKVSEKEDRRAPSR